MITVVICTYNRRSYLKKAIDSIINQAFDPDLYELIIVDNNSTDGTKEFVLNNYSHSRVKYLNETSQGLSHCRNTGLRNAKFDYIAYIDDDGIAYSDWLENMAKGIKDQNEKFAGITGAIFPIWEIPRPRWLLDKWQIGTNYSIYKHRDKRTVIRRGVKIGVFGGNMVWKKSLLIECGGFNTKLGRVKNNLISGEENFTAERIKNKGYEFIYDPKIRIKHHVHKSRMNIKWLIKRAFWGGYSHIAAENIKQSVLTKFRQSFKEIIRALFHIGSVPAIIIFKPRYHFLINIINAVNSSGRIYGLLRIK